MSRQYTKIEQYKETILRMKAKEYTRREIAEKVGITSEQVHQFFSLARNALIEFPVNEKIMLCLASVLYNAGYVRYGEYHLLDNEGYDILDVEKHRTYCEWKEAISMKNC